MDKHDYRVIPALVNQAIKGKSLSVFGKGKQTRTFCYITDAIDGTIKVISKGVSGECYNIGQTPSDEISMINLAKKIKKITNSKSEIQTIVHPELYPTDDPNRRAANINKIIEHTNYMPKVKIDESLKRFIKWAFKNY